MPVPTVDVTVLVVTYNHAAFIETAVRSVLRQETNFDFEIIVSEDCSTDGTRDIVRRLAGEHGDLLRLLLSERNRNDNSVVRRGLEAARGRYVALLDGDDFWTSTHKLQRQVEFLDSHPACSSCFHNVNVIYEEGDTPAHLFHQDERLPAHTQPKPKPRSSVADIVLYDFVPTCSVLFRAEIGRGLPPWYDGLPSGDWPLHVLSAERGKLAYIDDVMATYRVHRGGLWSMNQSRYLHMRDIEDLVRCYDTFDRHLGFAHKREIGEAVSGMYQGTATRAFRRGDYRMASSCAWRSIRRSRAATLPRRWKAAGVLAVSPFARVMRRR